MRWWPFRKKKECPDTDVFYNLVWKLYEDGRLVGGFMAVQHKIDKVNYVEMKRGLVLDESRFMRAIKGETLCTDFELRSRTSVIKCEGCFVYGQQDTLGDDAHRGIWSFGKSLFTCVSIQFSPERLRLCALCKRK